MVVVVDVPAHVVNSRILQVPAPQLVYSICRIDVAYLRRQETGTVFHFYPSLGFK